MKKFLAISALSIAFAHASGYKIPEQSLNALALSSANIAAVDGADASYYNPANMVFLSDKKSQLEAVLLYLNMPSMTYTDNRDPAMNGKSKDEKLFMPAFHFVIPEHYEDWRFGFSAVVPAGLAKRWDGPFQSATAKKFSFQVYEANPTAAYRITDWASIGFGARAIYSKGKVQTDGEAFNAMIPPAYSPYLQYPTMNMSGDSWDFGYNLALSLRPTDNLKLAATYRSKVDLTFEGNVEIAHAALPSRLKLDAGLTIPLPAVLDIAAAYTVRDTTLELVYERIFWSAYGELAFDVNVADPAVSATVNNVINVMKYKRWKDVNSYRVGVTHKVNDSLKLMVGLSIDDNPATEANLNFELPDSDAKSYSAGFEYKVNEDLSIGAAYLYLDAEKRKVKNDFPAYPALSGIAGIDGTFKNAKAHLVNIAFKYRF